jgi:glycosyltransferase involved in cell wall biosynthesis
MKPPLVDRRRVVILREDLLPLSQTFVKEQTLALRRWEAVLAGLRFVPGLDLRGLRCELISGWLPGRLSKKLLHALREVDSAPPGMRRQLRGLDPALVHVHFATDLVTLWPLVKGLQVPILVTLHGYDINIYKEFWQQSGYVGRRYPQRLLAISRDPRVRFIAVSSGIRARAIEYGIAPEKTRVKYIGVDVARFAPAEPPVSQRRRRILFVGRMVEKKGAALLIEAFARVRGSVQGAELIMIGDGPDLPAAKRLAQELNVPVSFRGSQPTEAVRAMLNEVRVFCLPSVTATNGDAEGLGIVILEAQACGVPVVTSARGADEGVLDGITGFVFPEKDVAALSARLCILLEDDERALAMSRAAREFILQRFDINNCTRALEDLYDEFAA